MLPGNKKNQAPWCGRDASILGAEHFHNTKKKNRHLLWSRCLQSLHSRHITCQKYQKKNAGKKQAPGVVKMAPTPPFSARNIPQIPHMRSTSGSWQKQKISEVSNFSICRRSEVNVLLAIMLDPVSVSLFCFCSRSLLTRSLAGSLTHACNYAGS